jgi:hypothetical protein
MLNALRYFSLIIDITVIAKIDEAKKALKQTAKIE